MDEYESLSHSKWECKYHVVFHSQVPEKDPVRGAETASRRCLPQAGAAEGKPSRRRPSHAGSRSHDDLDSTKICGLASGLRWSRLSEQIFRVNKWRPAEVKLPGGMAAKRSRLDRVSFRQGSNADAGHCRNRGNGRSKRGPRSRFHRPSDTPPHI